MSRSLCLIGNSHLVALQAASVAGTALPGWTLTFHGFRGSSIRDTALRDGHLVPLSQDAQDHMLRYSGADTLPLAHHDAFAVVGLNIKLLHAVSLWKEARWPGLPGLHGLDDLAGMAPRLMSRPAVRAALTGYLATLTGAGMARQLAAAFGRPVLLVPPPALHERARKTVEGRFLGLGRAIRMGDAPAIAALFAEAAEALCARIGAAYVPQPAETLRHHIMTRGAYMTGQAGGHAGNPVREDDKHANAEYGRLMLAAIAGALP